MLLLAIICGTNKQYAQTIQAGKPEGEIFRQCSNYNKTPISMADHVEQQKKIVSASFSKLKKLYKEAQISDTYLDSVSLAGTTAPLIAHALVHFQQNNWPDDPSLLKAVLIEGMADFIGELITGQKNNEGLYKWTRGREMQLWRDFNNDMYQAKTEEWINNKDRETADKPANIGYWIGYQICQAYYENSKNKQQALYDMLHIDDYKKFYEKSNAEAWIRKNKEE